MKRIVEPILVLSLAKTVAVLLGLVLTHRGWKAYRLKRDPAMFWLTMGMGVLTLSAVAEGAVFNLLRWDLAWSQALGAITTMTAFGVLLYSLHA